MEFRLKPVETVIAKIVRDLGLGDREVPYQDYIEWFYEALQLIGNYTLFTEILDAPVKVENYRGKLPTDFFTMIANPGLQYNLSNDTITVPMKDGIVKINYLAMPVDNRGYPMVPDNVSFDNALMWHVAQKLAIRGELTNKNLSVEFCRNEWFRYCRQARAQANALGADALERNKDMRMKLVPDIHRYEFGFGRVDNRFKEDTPDGRK